MKKLLIASLAIFFLVNCTKTIILNPSVIRPNGIKSVELTADTTIMGIWDGGGKIITIHNYKIHGTGTFQNWNIDAADNVQIFDTSINLVKIKAVDDVFCTAWYGVSAANPNNWWNLQKSVNACYSNGIYNCYTSDLGVINYKDRVLEFDQIVNGKYQQSSIHFYGNASFWDIGIGTTFKFNSVGYPAMNAQLNKGSEFDHFQLFGLWKSPGGVDSVYFNLSEANYKDQSGNNLPDWYTGFGVDFHPPLDGVTKSGSTGIHIHDLIIGNFATLLAMSYNGITQNDDVMRVENLQLKDGKYGIVGCQAQEKGMEFKSIASWGSIYNVVNIGLHGAYQAGNYQFDGANIAGRCIEPIKMSIGHWFSSSFNNWYCENINDVGNFSLQMPVTITNSNFDLNINYNKHRNALISNSTYLTFHGCTFRYYDGQSSNVYYHGYATVPPAPDNYFGGGSWIAQ